MSCQRNHHYSEKNCVLYFHVCTTGSVGTVQLADIVIVCWAMTPELEKDLWPNCKLCCGLPLNCCILYVCGWKIITGISLWMPSSYLVIDDTFQAGLRHQSLTCIGGNNLQATPLHPQVLVCRRSMVWIFALHKPTQSPKHDSPFVNVTGEEPSLGAPWCTTWPKVFHTYINKAS